MAYDEHSRCREIAERMETELARLQAENTRLRQALDPYEAAETLTVTQACQIPTEDTEGDTTLSNGDRIVVIRETEKKSVFPIDHQILLDPSIRQKPNNPDMEIDIDTTERYTVTIKGALSDKDRNRAVQTLMRLTGKNYTAFLSRLDRKPEVILGKDFSKEHAATIKSKLKGVNVIITSTPPEVKLRSKLKPAKTKESLAPVPQPSVATPAKQKKLGTPRTGGYFREWGDIFFSDGRYDDAYKYYDKAIETQPSCSTFYFAKGRLLCKLSRFTEALSVFNEAIAIDHTHAEYHYFKGVALHMQGKYKEAVTVFDEAIDWERNALFLYMKGSALEHLKRHVAALQAYDSAISSEPTYALAHINRSRPLFALGRHNEAIAACDKAIEFDPTNADFYAVKAQLLNSLGRNKEAVAAMKKSKEYKGSQ